MIRKEGKARWTYTCEPCDETVTCADQFRAIEFAHWHERSYAHAGVAFGNAMSNAIKELAKITQPALDAVASLTEAFATPQNKPHDPALLRDRRKWGGK